MLRMIVAAGLAAALAGCTTPRAENGAAPPPGETVLGIISTPFVVAFKIPVCVASAVVAAPIVGASLVAGDGPEQQELRQVMGEGLAENCGPPWGVNP